MSSQLKSSSKSQDADEFAKPAAFWDMYFLAMIIVIGKQYYRWNLVLDDGFWSIVTAMLLNGIGYVCLSFCMSEMSSTLPFSGGIYGFVRAFLGPYSGYIASRFEIILNICYVSSAALAIGAFPTYAGISSRNVEPAWWCLMYGFAMTMSLIGCSPYWAWNKVMGCTALVLMLVYILGSLPSVDYTAYANGNEAFNGAHFMSAFPYTSPMFLGIQYLPLISGKCSDPKKDIPKGMLYTMCSLFITAIAVVFIVSCQAPGTLALADEFLPLSYGFAKMFNISYERAIYLSLPAIYANFYGFVWAYGRQMSAMAKSGLLPDIFTWMSPWTDTPYIASIFGTVVSFSIALCAFYNVFYDSFKTDLIHISTLSSNAVYMLLFASYILFKGKYSSLARSFYSPLGIYGAFLGMMIFLLNIIGTLGFAFEDNGQMPLIILVVICVLMTIYYFTILHGNQKFSEEEKQELFKAYLINANTQNRQNIKKKHAAKHLSQQSLSQSPIRRVGSVELVEGGNGNSSWMMESSHTSFSNHMPSSSLSLGGGGGGGGVNGAPTRMSYRQVVPVLQESTTGPVSVSVPVPAQQTVAEKEDEVIPPEHVGSLLVVASQSLSQRHHRSSSTKESFRQSMVGQFSEQLLSYVVSMKRNTNVVVPQRLMDEAELLALEEQQTQPQPQEQPLKVSSAALPSVDPNMMVGSIPSDCMMTSMMEKHDENMIVEEFVQNGDGDKECSMVESL